MINKCLAALLAVLLSVGLVSCDSNTGPNSTNSSGAEIPKDALRIVAATELQDMEELVKRAEQDLGFSIHLTYPDGTIGNSRSLARGEFDRLYDATWFATNKYVDLQEAGDKIVDSRSVATSPIAFGIHKKKATELGWDSKRPTWAEITKAAEEKKFQFGMTDPGRSNSGFSALVSVASANADTGAALTTHDIERVSTPLHEFFQGQNLISGSSGWLEQAFSEDPDRTDAMINYESVLLKLQKDNKADIEVVVPSDGVISADYPLSALKRPYSDDAAERVQRLGEWMVQHNQDIVEHTQRRPVDPKVQATAAQKSNPLIELPFPARQDVADALVAQYNNELRVPAKTVFVLDRSGSMAGQRINDLQEIMTQLIDGTAVTRTGPVGLRNREQISLITFNQQTDSAVSETFSTTDTIAQQKLVRTIDGMEAQGQTAIYDSLLAAFSEFGSNTDGEIPSIVLMTDGENNIGTSYRQFAKDYQALSEDKKRIPVFVILYGEANQDEMKQLAALTKGKVFDATSGNLGEAFKEIRGYQ